MKLNLQTESLLDQKIEKQDIKASKKEREKLLQNAMKLAKSFEQDRTQYEAEWIDLRDYINPKVGRMLTDGEQQQIRGLYKHVLDSEPYQAVRVLAAGMLGGMASPSRKWFDLTIRNKDKKLEKPINDWTKKLREELLTQFNKSNFYTAIHKLIREAIHFGTSVMLIEVDNKENRLFFDTLSCGEYYLSQTTKDYVDTLMRKQWMTADQIVDEFGDDTPECVQDAYNEHDIAKKFEVFHIIRPRKKFDPEKNNNKSMPYSSLHFMKKSDTQKGAILRVSGYKKRPFVVLPFEERDKSPYGDTPASNALSDIKTLYEVEKANLNNLKQTSKPPVMSKGLQKNSLIDISPGSVTYVPTSEHAGVSPIFQPYDSYSKTTDKVERLEQKIAKIFYNHLFLGVMNRNKTMSATEVDSVNTEILTNITPVVELLAKKALDPTLDRSADLLIELGKMPIPDVNIQGLEFEVEYVSVLAKAQKQSDVAAKQKAIVFISQMTGVHPQIIDNFDWDRMGRDAFDAYCLSEYIKPLDIVNKARKERAQKQQQKESTQESIEATKAMKDIGSIDAQNAKDLMSNMGMPTGE